MYLKIWVSPEISPKPETSGSSVSLAILSARGWCFRLWWEWRQIFILHSPCFAPCFAHMIFGKHQWDIRLEGRMTPDQSMAADFLGQPRHAAGFLGRYIFSGIPWYAGGFERYCFYSCVHVNWLGSEKTETNDSHSFQLKSTRHIQKSIHLLLHWHNIVGKPAGNASKGVIGSH